MRDRERLRLWFWLSCAGLVLALVIGGGIALVVREIGQMRQQVAQQAAAFEAAQQEYQRQLAHDRAMQAERAAAAKAIGYQANQSAPVYNANLLRGFIDFMGKSGELRERLQHLDGNDPEDLERFAGDLEKVLHQGLGTLGQVVLRNTEPSPGPGPEKAAPPAPATQKPPPAAQ
jgi:type II secretory pathway pseudopilin PulG